MNQMTVSGLTTFGHTLHFRQAVWLFPLATALHFLEEGRRFSTWAKKYLSPEFTFAHWSRIHAIGLAYAVAFTVVLVWRPNRVSVFLFFALCFSQVVYNMLFHVSTTLAFGTYSPGVLTAVGLYPLLFIYLNGLAAREGLLTSGAGLLAFAIAAGIHALDVAYNVFLFRFVRSKPRATMGVGELTRTSGVVTE